MIQEKEKFVYEKMFSKENIVHALYSVESYISNRELLDSQELEQLHELRDRFDFDNINHWVDMVSNRLHEIIDEDGFLETNLFFKPKKYVDNKVEFRPIHKSNILDLVTMVSMLNMLIYEYSSENKITLSSLSMLIPHSFYGNKLSTIPERVFSPWKVQYREYNEKANELYEKYNENKQYSWEVSLDIENFFPSINPLHIYNYILKKLPASYTENDINCIKKVLEKLLFVKISNELSNKEIKIYSKGILKNDCKFAIGLPQGLPQCYFFANVYMIEIDKIYKNVFGGKRLYYVDDSVIFTNELENENDLDEKIQFINEKIKSVFSKYLSEKIENPDIIEFLDRISALLNVKIHGLDGKSTLSHISDLKSEDIYFHFVGREASMTGFEMNTTFSDEEIVTLTNKTKALFNAIEDDLKRIKDITDKNISENEQAAYKKKLIRYRKYFKYRYEDLLFRGDEDERYVDSLLEKFSFVDKRKKEGLEEFFEKYNEDTLASSISSAYKKLNEQLVLNADSETKLKKSSLNDKISKLNKLLFGFDNQNTSYLIQTQKQFIGMVCDVRNDSMEYRSLKNLVAQKIPTTVKKQDKVRTQILEDEVRKIADNNNFESYFEDFVGKENAQIYAVINANSEKMYRYLINAVLSYICMIEISNDFHLQKKGTRLLTYSELRTLIFVRNQRFSLGVFRKLYRDFWRDEYKQTIDYSVLQVVDCFRIYVRNPLNIDNLIIIHKYTCDAWKNGSKFLYFYTLHNQEHAIDLIRSSVKVVKTIDLLNVSANDYYILFIACYLHDISMVTMPDLDCLQKDEFASNKISSDFAHEIKKLTQEGIETSSIKKLLREYYTKLDSFYENKVRSRHAFDSAKEIRNRSDFLFMDNTLRDIVAEVSEAHGHDVKEIYDAKGGKGATACSKKIIKIILRLADLLDMSSYRVSRLILNHNLNNMSEISRFHWLSHLITNSYSLESIYEARPNRKKPIAQHSMQETIKLTVYVSMANFSGEDSLKCSNSHLENLQRESLSIVSEANKCCNGANCNFLCKWFHLKNEYLFEELAALEEYLTKLPRNYFNTSIKVEVKVDTQINLSTEQFTMLKEFVDGR